MKYTHIVFDVDGTLIDSEKAVLKSLRKTIEEEGINKSLDDLKFALGIPGKDALSVLGIEDLEGVEERWNENLLKYSDEMKLFEGIKQVIQELKCKSVSLGIVTSKTRKEYETDFLKFGLNSYFDLVICADDTRKHKPDKEPIEKYIEITKAKKEETIYIGDSIYDMQCSKDAGVDFALALWGANETEKIKAEYKLKTPKSILGIIMKPDVKNMEWLDWAIELQHLAQVGLAYSKDPYDIERFKMVRHISAEIISSKTELNFDKVNDLFCNETGFQTPKLDTRAAIFEDNKILLVKEISTNTWSLPGGWVDVDQSIYSNTVKEVKEEAGLDVIPSKLIAIQDRNKHNIPRYAYGVCKVFMLCKALGGEFKENIETCDSGFFSLDELPELDMAKNTKDQIKMCFLAEKDPNWQTIFD